MDLAKFFSLSYLFDLTLGPWQQYGFFVFVLSISIIALGIVLKILEHFLSISEVNTRLLNKLSPFFITNGFFALFLWFTRQQRMPLFSARFWWLVLMIVVFAWLFFLIRNIFRFKRNKAEMLAKKKVFDNYLPQRKK